MSQYQRSSQKRADCLIIGAGPAGLLAAVYLARFRRNVIIVDAQKSRAKLIPKSHNIPGFTGGVSGEKLLAHLMSQASHLGIEIRLGTVTDLRAVQHHGFDATIDAEEVVSVPKVIIATGMVDIHPDVSGWQDATATGVLRYCPICDGYEAINKRIAVIGSTESAFKKAIFLRAYSPHVSLLTSGTDYFDRNAIEANGIKQVTPELTGLEPDERRGGVEALFYDGSRLHFDVLYPALGSDVRSQLAIQLGARHTDSGS